MISPGKINFKRVNLVSKCVCLLAVLFYLHLRDAGLADEVVCPTVDCDKCPEGVTFWLYTRCNASNPIQLFIPRLRERLAWFAPCNKIVVLVHGFQGSHVTQLSRLIKAFFYCGEYNIVSLDWGYLCKAPCYTQAVHNIPAVAVCVSEMVNALSCYFPGSHVHVIGFSLGARCVAFASYHCTVHTLTCIDSAKPLIPAYLDVPGCAGFIVYHHCSGSSLGISCPKGHADIYWNSGIYQYGCGCEILCSHNRCIENFAASICKIPLYCFPCDREKAGKGEIILLYPSCYAVVAGEHNNNWCGSCFAPTTREPPYLMGAKLCNVTGKEANCRFDRQKDPYKECPLEVLDDVTKVLALKNTLDKTATKVVDCLRFVNKPLNPLFGL